MTERLRRVNYGKLETESSVDDPKAHMTPWTIKLNQFIVLDTELLDFVCLETKTTYRTWSASKKAASFAHEHTPRS